MNLTVSIVAVVALDSRLLQVVPEPPPCSSAPELCKVSVDQKMAIELSLEYGLDPELGPPLGSVFGIFEACGTFDWSLTRGKGDAARTVTIDATTGRHCDWAPEWRPHGSIRRTTTVPRRVLILLTTCRPT